MRSIHRDVVSFSQFSGTNCLVVNVASRCAFTSQYKGLVELHNNRQDKNFSVLAFPCNQFMGQEPGSEEEICQFVKTHYRAPFPVFSKVRVNGNESCELFRWLTENLRTPWGMRRILWNFTKFLVDRDGNPVKRWESWVAPEKIDRELDRILV